MKDLVSVNPYTQQNINSYSQTSEESLMSSINKSYEMYLEWRDVDVLSRSEQFRSLAQVLNENKIGLAQMATDEMGKPLLQAISEVEKCAKVCEYYAENAGKILAAKTIKTEAQKAFVTYQPLGTILAIMPWNFPYWQAFRVAVPTIMAGNAVLLKHASNVSGCALKIQEMFEKAGFPEGIFQTLLISSDRVEDVIKNRHIKGVSLTGSTEAGKKVASTAGANLKRQVLELGGSDPYIVLSDADIKEAAKLCMKSRLQNNGQSCIAAKRFIVMGDVYQEFKDEILKITQATVVGDPNDEKTDLGPLARKGLKEELHKQVLSAIHQGAKIVHEGDYKDNDCFYPITILENINSNNSAYHEEFFGPVIQLYNVRSVDEAVKIANDSSFGLGSAIFSKDIEAAVEIATTQIQAGGCFINSMLSSDPRLPFGGINDSGYGRELSEDGIFEFVNIKTVSVEG